MRSACENCKSDNPKLDVTLEGKGSSTDCYISWSRLEYHLKISGELKPSESLDSLSIDGHGISYRVNSN